MKRIILTGFAGCFKTTAGEIVAKKLNLPFFDTDRMIVEQQNMSISEIFSKKGENFFRQLEAQALLQLPTHDAVVSLGGGTLTQQNGDFLHQNSTIIWLYAHPRTTFERISQSQHRPLYYKKSADEIAQMVAQRSKIYQNFADIKIPTDDKSCFEVADSILKVVLF